MLLHKAWLETRSRFIFGIALAVGVCLFFVIGNPLIIKQWLEDRIEHPDWYEAAWLSRAIDEYPFFLWHFLFSGMLQQLIVLFALLLGFGGLAHEKVTGTVSFSLSLPVTRRGFFWSRTLVVVLELLAIGVVAAIVLFASSYIIGKSIPLVECCAHCLLVVLGSLVFYGYAVFLSNILSGEYTATLVGISTVALLYSILQPYVDAGSMPPMINAINIPKVMAGVPRISSIVEFPWLGLMASACVSAALLFISSYIIEKNDF